uniref:Cardiolipin synthase (CMP-forming) n=1 Tax=Oreochromis niloticus TaxID=8128 RepID=A0A669EH71_ORENI
IFFHLSWWAGCCLSSHRVLLENRCRANTKRMITIDGYLQLSFEAPSSCKLCRNIYLFIYFLQYENPWTIPNLLCVCRILLAPFLGHLIIQQKFHLSLALFTLAGATDLLDGYIARTWPTQKSALGSALDPLADKILISILYVSLTYAELIPAPLTALVIFRDIGLIAAVFWVRYKTVPPPVTLTKFFNPCYTTAQLKPTLISKINTAIQFCLVAASLAAPVFQYTDSILLQCLWYITAVTTAASGYSYWHYGRKTVQVLNTRSPS